MKIDGDRLLAWLDEQEAALRSAQEGFEPDQNAYHSLGGGLVIIRSIRANLGSMTESREPLNKIQAPTKLKVRRRAPETSWEAAYAQTPEKSQRLYRAIHYALTKFGPMTDDELRVKLKPILDTYNYAPEGVTMRRGELVKADWVRASGERRPGDSGSLMTVWEVIPDGA